MDTLDAIENDHADDVVSCFYAMVETVNTTNGAMVNILQSSQITNAIAGMYILVRLIASPHILHDLTLILL